MLVIAGLVGNRGDVTARMFAPDARNEFSLGRSRDELTTGYTDPSVVAAVNHVLERVGESGYTPLLELQGILDRLRAKPHGAERISGMNSFVRTLGRADNLATFTELLRASLSAVDPAEARLAAGSQNARMHCIYGWSGQTLALVSGTRATAGTMSPAGGVAERCGYPIAMWFLSIHIWQPNVDVEGFARTKRIEPGVLAEPPHSHPYSFVSYVSIGSMRQSTYRDEATPSGDDTRYSGVPLQRVDGVWPPHTDVATRYLSQVEDRVDLRTGHSYYMPTDCVHDVEVDRACAAHAPTITLFLAAETTTIPNAYLESAMAEFHHERPDVKDVATALNPEEWSAKLAATARYLRGEATDLRLEEVFRCNSTYGFMHT